MQHTGSWDRTCRPIAHLIILMLLATLLTGCILPSGELAQGSGLPTLRRLYWGYNYFDEALWSPDGRWIAAMAGTDPANSHFVGLSPDGQTRQDLSSWGWATGLAIPTPGCQMAPSAVLPSRGS